MKVISEMLVMVYLEDIRREAAHMVAMLEAGRYTSAVDVVTAKANLASIDRKIALLKTCTFDATEFYRDIFNIPTVEKQEEAG
jgi:hypothetical protein